MKQLALICLFASIENILSKDEKFVCPKDGRWPHPADCEKYYTCNSGIDVEGWCGSGMTYDPDHQRCDLSKNIECKNGERPSWTPPEGWGQSDRVTEYVVTKTTSSSHPHRDEFDDEGEGENDVKDNEEKTTRIFKKRKTTTRMTTIVSKIAAHRVTIPISELVENNACNFQGNMPDPENCQSFYKCSEDVVSRTRCPEKQLFDEEMRQCQDYRKVFCANRPVNERETDPCLGKTNGWYADMETQCRSYYFCAEQRKSKMGECSANLKWNSARVRCDDPRQIVAPCGIRTNNSDRFISNYFFVVCLFLIRFY